MRISKSLLLRILVAVVLLSTLFLLQADLTRTLRLILSAKWPYLLAAFAVAVLGEVLTAYKLKRLFLGAGHRVGMGLVTRSCFIAMFYNNVLPGSVGGDIARVFLLARSTGGKAMAAAGVFMQRNTGLAGLLAVALAASLLPPYLLHVFSGALGWLDYVFVWFAAVALAYAGVNAFLVSDHLYHLVWVRVMPLLGVGPDSLTSLPAVSRSSLPAFDRGRNFLRTAALKVQRLHVSVRCFQGTWPMALGISVLTQLVDCVLVLLAGRSLGLDLSFQFLCVCVPAVSLAALMPVSVNGIGLREWVYSFFLVQAGGEKEYAVALSLLHFGVFLGMSAIGGFLQWTGARTERQKDVRCSSSGRDPASSEAGLPRL